MRTHSSLLRRIIAIGTVAVVLIVVAMIMIEPWSHDDEMPPKQAGDLFCTVTMDMDFAAALRSAEGAQGEDGEMIKSTLSWVYSDKFVAGAPARLRDEAQHVVDMLEQAAKPGRLDASQHAEYLADFRELRSAARSLCRAR